MENNSQTKSTKTNKPALILSLLLAALVAGGVVYFWQHTKVTSLNSSVANLEQQLSRTNQTKLAMSSDEQVLAAVKTYCTASVDPVTKQPLVLSVGTSGPNNERVTYSADKNFAAVNAICSDDGTTGGSGSAYYLKKVNDTWLFLYRGQMTSPEDIKQFNIPDSLN